MKLLSITVDLSRARWRKSSFSGGGGSNCVEVADAGQVIAVRDSKDAPGPVLVFGHLDTVAASAAAETALPPPGKGQVEGDAHQFHAAPSHRFGTPLSTHGSG